MYEWKLTADLKLYFALESSGGLIKMWLVRPHPQFLLQCVQWGQRICFSDEVSGDADPAGPGSSL